MSGLPPRVGIAGLGLMGGSLARALAVRAPEVTLAGWDPDHGAMSGAGRELPSLAARDGLADLARSVDMLVLAGPVDAILRGLGSLAELELPSLLVTDVGSTKAAIVARAAALPRGVAFVGGHPIAGSERRGLGASRADLFEGVSWALTPAAGGAEAEGVAAVSAMAERVGARPVVMPPDVHDEIAAATSHLPQLLAVALCNLVADVASRHPDALALAGRGFRDMTRIASSPAETWRPIVASNQEAIDAAFVKLARHLAQASDTQDLAETFARAAELRRRLAEGS